jgi:hypothetical protein
MQQNITLKIERHLLQHAKSYASRQNTSLSALMKNLLEKFLAEKEGYEKAKKKALALMKKRFNLGGGPYYSSRDELHERHGR